MWSLFPAARLQAVTRGLSVGGRGLSPAVARASATGGGARAREAFYLSVVAAAMLLTAGGRPRPTIRDHAVTTARGRARGRPRPPVRDLQEPAKATEGDATHLVADKNLSGDKHMNRWHCSGSPTEQNIAVGLPSSID